MRIAFCPHPPLLIPAVAQGAAAELDDLRGACDRVVRGLVGGPDETVTVVGASRTAGHWDGAAGGTLAAFGIGVRAGGATAELPLSLTVGAWLLDRAGYTGARTYVVAAADEILDLRGPVLVMADGTAKRTEQAPGHIDERASTYDKAIAHALGSGDADALASLDPELGARLWAGGVPALRCVGRSIVATTSRVAESQLLYDEAPYGVGYFVAEWEVA